MQTLGHNFARGATDRLSQHVQMCGPYKPLQSVFEQNKLEKVSNVHL